MIVNHGEQNPVVKTLEDAGNPQWQETLICITSSVTVSLIFLSVTLHREISSELSSFCNRYAVL